MRSARVPRWAVSFADLCLLLLGFFVLMQAHQARPDQLAAGLRSAFGESPVALPGGTFRADDIFQRGEAVLTSAAMADFTRIGREAEGAGLSIQVVSTGTDGAARRFDRWELAAARAAAVARALRAGGMAEDRVALAMPSTPAGADEPGQVIRVLSVPAGESP